MGAWLANLVRGAPLLTIFLSVAGSGGAGLTAGWVAHGFAFDTFTRPEIVRQQEALCEQRTRAQAEEAKTRERNFQIAVADRVLEQFRLAQEEADQAAATKASKRQLEIAAYEASIDDPARCALTQRDLDFLSGRSL